MAKNNMICKISKELKCSFRAYFYAPHDDAFQGQRREALDVDARNAERPVSYNAGCIRSYAACINPHWDPGFTYLLLWCLRISNFNFYPSLISVHADGKLMCVNVLCSICTVRPENSQIRSLIIF